MLRTWFVPAAAALHPVRLALAASLVAGCVKGGGDTQTAATATEPAPVVQGPPIEQPGDTAAYARENVDFNNDGRPESVNYTSGGALVRKDVDINQDGRFDVVSYYGSTGTLSKELMDGDFDGRIDWVDIYEAGARVRAEVDTDYDGKIDTIFHYTNDQVTRKERFAPI